MPSKKKKDRKESRDNEVLTLETKTTSNRLSEVLNIRSLFQTTFGTFEPHEEMAKTLRAAKAKGIRNFSFFGLRPSSTVTATKSFSLGDEETASALFRLMNYHEFASVALVDCELNWRSVNVFQNYAEV